MEIFNNRELAAIIWLLVIAVYLSKYPKSTDYKASFKDILSAFFVLKIQLPIALMLIYISGIVYGLYELGLWEVSQLKNTLIWTFSIAFLSLFQTDKIKEDHNVLKHLLIDYLKLIAIIEFFIGLYVFPLLVELIMLPILTLLVISSEIIGRDEKNQRTKKAIDTLLSIAGVIMLVLALYMLISNFALYINGETLTDFITPPLLTLCYLPFIFFFMVYVTYETTNIRLEYHIEGRKQRIFATVLASVIFNTRVKLLERWSSSLAHVDTTSYRELWKSITKMLRHYKYERKPEIIDPKYGWCPYKALDFLNSQGISTNNYHPSFEEWFASSRLLDIGSGVLPNNIAAYVEGEEKIAKKLTVKLNINELDDTKIAREKFINIVCDLFEFAISPMVPQWLLNTIETNSTIEKQIENTLISVSFDKYNYPSCEGYTLKVVFLNKS